MKFLKVNLWGEEIGRLVWDEGRRNTYFEFSPINKHIPDVAPFMKSAMTSGRKLIYGDERPIYQGLPPFIADSLPDSWGNMIFDRWVHDNRIPRSKITPLYKLMFIGSRGMGALEYEPAATELATSRDVDINSLYKLSCAILEDRKIVSLSPDDELTMSTLLSVGTSAGGRQMKAIIAIHKETGEIRSGQTENSEGFDYYILKFGDSSIPLAEIEYVFFELARKAGINMEDSRLLSVEDINHFLTKRFDRDGSSKIFTQTLAALNPDAKSYEDLFETCRALNLGHEAYNELFRRLVFNVLANNTDDHNKNFSFCLNQNGVWRLAPAYDMTFIFNNRGTGANKMRRMSINGKVTDIDRKDLIDFAKKYDIRNPNTIIDEVVESLTKYDILAEKHSISRPWRDIIQKTLNDNIAIFDSSLTLSSTEYKPIIDANGRIITSFEIKINSRGDYEVKATIDGVPRRRVVGKNNPFYHTLNSKPIYGMTPDSISMIVESLFPA